MATVQEKVKNYISTPGERSKLREELNSIEKYREFLTELIIQTAKAAETKAEDKEILTQLVQDLLNQTGRKYENGNTNTNKDQTLPTNIPKFSGRKGDEYTTWIISVENSIALKKITDENAFIAIAPFLEGFAATLYQHYTKRNRAQIGKLKFTEFKKDCLDKEFANNEDKLTLYDKFTNLKLSDCGSLENYNYEFRKLMMDTESENTPDLIVKYTNGLGNKKIKMEIIEKVEPSDNLEKQLEKAMKHAKKSDFKQQTSTMQANK